MAENHVPVVGSHVIISGGKKAGSVTSLITASDRVTVSGFVVHYGWRKRKAKVVPIEDVKWVNPDNVVLTLSRHQFDKLADWTSTSDSDAPMAEPASNSGVPAGKPAHP